MAITAIAAAAIFTLAIMTASITASPPSAPATTTTATTTTTTTSPEEAAMIELSPEVVYQERQIVAGETQINQTHVELAISGNGTLTFPNTTETISTTSTGSVLTSIDGTAAGKEMFITVDGSESATATFYAIYRFDIVEGTGRGIIISLVDTNSTGRLAPLDGMILAGQIEFQPDESAVITLWDWQSGIPLAPTTTAPEEPALTETTTTTDNTTRDTNNATEEAAPATIEEEEEEPQEQEQETTLLQ